MASKPLAVPLPVCGIQVLRTQLPAGLAQLGLQSFVLMRTTQMDQANESVLIVGFPHPIGCKRQQTAQGAGQ
jgi:hypothetical protein